MALPPGHLIDPFGATTAAVCINTPSRHHHHQQQQPTTTTTTPDTTTNNATECDSAAPVPDAGNSHTTNANVPPPFQNTPYAPAQPPQQQSTTAIAEGAAAADPSWPEPNANYLAQLIKDKRQITSLPNMFLHVDRLLDKEISNVREKLMQKQNTIIGLPEPEGQIVTVSQKLYIPVDEHPDFNFIGRILGPRGMTAKQLESETGCKIMVRGKGSIRDRAKEEQMKDKPNWQHLSDNLHVLITCEDYENRAGVKLKSAAEKVSRLLEPKPEGEDELKKRQLIELAKLNGTYRDNSFYSQLVASLARFQFMPPNILSSMVELPSHLSASAVPPAYPHQQHQVVNALAAAAAAAAAANVSGSSVFVTSADPGSFVKLRKDLLVRSLANPPSHPLLSAEPPQRSSYIDPGTILQNAAFVNPALFYIPTQQQQPHATDATSLNGLITPTTSAAAANTNYSHVTTAANNHRTDTCCDNSSTSSSSSTTDTMNTCFNDINSGTTNTGPIRHPTNNSHQRPVPPSLLLQPSFQQQQPRGLGSVQTHYHQWIRQQTHPYNRPENQC